MMTARCQRRCRGGTTEPFLPMNENLEGILCERITSEVSEQLELLSNALHSCGEARERLWGRTEEGEEASETARSE